MVSLIKQCEGYMLYFTTKDKRKAAVWVGPLKFEEDLEVEEIIEQAYSENGENVIMINEAEEGK